LRKQTQILTEAYKGMEEKKGDKGPGDFRVEGVDVEDATGL